MLLCTHIYDFLISTATVSLARRFYAHYSLSHDSDMIAKFLFAIMWRENLTGNCLSYNQGKELHQWEQLCPYSTLFDYKVPYCCIVDSYALSDFALMHWMQVAICTLMYILYSRPDLLILTYSAHQVANFVIIWVLLMSRLLIIAYFIWLGAWDWRVLVD